MHAALEGGNATSSGMDAEDFHAATAHMTPAATRFLATWLRLVQLEHAGSSFHRAAIWRHMDGNDHTRGSSTRDLLLHSFLGHVGDQYRYRFVQQAGSPCGRRGASVPCSQSPGSPTHLAQAVTGMEWTAKSTAAQATGEGAAPAAAGVADPPPGDALQVGDHVVVSV